ncbi:MAG: MBL fold metallo-hydrolase [Calditrichaeota bacterium]|nr:MAG: MBL fold metallo-hydrolase [Calditrichota bacterium]RPH99345.1 MAG: MBL fold metallo-hydrolase [Calditrichota bacterium]
MFEYDARGIRIKNSEFWLDAHRVVPFSFVSHGHSDHIKNHPLILATPPTIRFHHLRARQKQVLSLDFRRPYQLGDMTIELYPSGHILGSAMIRIEKDGSSLLYTGDFKLKKSWTTCNIEIPQADILIMESTFGHPLYTFDITPEDLVAHLITFIEDCIRSSVQPIVLAYGLGKAQEAMKILGSAGYEVKVHRAAWEIAQIYEQFGAAFENCTLWKNEPLKSGQVLIVPPHLMQMNKLKDIPPRRRTVLLSGWAKSESGHRFGSDHMIPLSDHADFNELLSFVKQVNPHKIFTTHGFEDFPAHLRNLGYDADLLKNA